MKLFKLYVAALCLLFYKYNSAQVLVDHPIQLTGGGVNAKVSGIKNVSDKQDATSVDYIQRDSLQFAPATPPGANNAYLVNLSPPIDLQYSMGMIVHFKANFANTGPATLSVNSLPPDTIKKNFNNDLAPYDIQNGQMVSVIFDGTYFQVMSQLGNNAGPHGKQLFKSNGTFNVPGGVTRVWVSMSGGGGGGSYGSSGGSGGGGADAVMDSSVIVTAPSYAITVGSGGTGGTSGNHNGGNGGNTSFGNLLITNGGSGGTSSGGGAAGGTGGVNGLIGNCCANQAGGPGGGSLFGCGGGGAVYNQDGGNGSGFGGGGGGGDSAYGSNGGNGAQGYVLVEW